MKVQRWFSLLMTIIETLLYAGILYGWGSLNPVLVQEGFFSDGCSNENKTKHSGRGIKLYDVLESDKVCDSQASMLDLVFTIASTVAPVLSLFTGIIFDMMGGWFTRTYCLTVMAFGLSMCALTTPESSSLLFLSFSLVAYAGMGLSTVNMQMANLFPKCRSSICTLISGLYDSSALIFLLFYKINGRGISYMNIFLFHAFLCVFFHAFTFLLTPRQPPEAPLPEDYVYGYHEISFCSGSKSEQPKIQFAASNDDDAMSFRECLKLPYTWTNVAHACVLQFCMANFIGNFNLWINCTYPDEDAASIDRYTTLFGVVQCCGVVFAPLSGVLMDYLRSHFTRTLPPNLASLKSAAFSILIATIFTVLMFVFSLIPIFKLQLATFLMQAIGRAFICGTLSAFLNIVYPTRHFGKMYGLNIAISGVVLLLQYPLTLLITTKLNSSFTMVNIVLLILSVLAASHPLYIFYYVHKLSKLEESNTSLMEGCN